MIFKSAGMNYSVTGFELILTRKMSFYIVTYYLPSGNILSATNIFTKFFFAQKKPERPDPDNTQIRWAPPRVAGAMNALKKA